MGNNSHITQNISKHQLTVLRSIPGISYGTALALIHHGLGKSFAELLTLYVHSFIIYYVECYKAVLVVLQNYIKNYRGFRCPSVVVFIVILFVNTLV